MVLTVSVPGCYQRGILLPYADNLPIRYQHIDLEPQYNANAPPPLLSFTSLYHYPSLTLLYLAALLWHRHP
jgi:hypothetical protein